MKALFELNICLLICPVSRDAYCCSLVTHFICFYFLQSQKKRNLEEVDEVQDRHGEIFEMEKQTWSIDKASDQRMVYVPKATVVEFMKKVRIGDSIDVHFIDDALMFCDRLKMSPIRESKGMLTMPRR